MIGDITVADKIYIVCGYTDKRKSIDGLCAIVMNQLNLNPMDRSLFLFCGRKCDRIKILMWEPDAFVLLYKRLAVAGRYRWPVISLKPEILPDRSSIGSSQVSI